MCFDREMTPGPGRQLHRFLHAVQPACASGCLHQVTDFDMAFRAAMIIIFRTIGTTPDFWLSNQAQFDIETVQQGMGKDIAAIKPRKIA